MQTVSMSHRSSRLADVSKSGQTVSSLFSHYNQESLVLGQVPCSRSTACHRRSPQLQTKSCGLAVTASSQGSEAQMRAGETVFSLRVCFCAASGLVVQMNHCNSAALREYSKGAARCRGCKGEMFRRDIMSESALITIHTLNRAELTHTQT